MSLYPALDPERIATLSPVIATTLCATTSDFAASCGATT